MRAFVVTATLALLTLETTAPATAGSAADAIAEKFAHASDPSPPRANPTPSEPDSTAERARLEAEREAETLHLAERLRAARKAKAEALDREERERQASEAAKTAASPPMTPACPPSVEAKAAPPASPPLALTSAAPAGAAPATILLALDPGTYGIRRFNPASADPVLCIGDTCYVSQGSATPAKALPKAIALGTGNTLGARAGACRAKLACIFRDVPLPSPKAELQPVDLHILRHDRRETAEASPDTSCQVAAGRLACSMVIRSATYRAVAVPEQVAKSAGSAALEAALPMLSNAKTATIAAP